MKWNSGPPPAVGWWNASLTKHPAMWRWWNGKRWSIAAHDQHCAAEAAERAVVLSKSNNRVQWRNYWPAGARVERHG
jgi:hypothetical protein